ncbi:hypothetical protein SNE40_022213 [Patella caerulea]|uniref:Cep192-like domain-containing protein n=1 Tax=Patella caerulea TaxID=87958 RepID=A0AAN8G514_PATCE
MPTVGNYDRSSSGPLAVAVKRDMGLLVDTMEIVEPVKKNQYVPNHILETKTFAKVGKNSMIHAQPTTIHFDGFNTFTRQSQTLSIVNASTEVICIHIIPPQTKHFSIKYIKNKRMVPGLTLDCVIEFEGDEWRYYYDCVRINCQGEENLMIPLHAYPVLNLKEFPQNFVFPPVPVGETMSQTFPLKCEVPVDFEYQLEYIRPHPFFTVKPMSGCIPANGTTDIVITFSPCEFLTAQMTLQLITSQFNSKPIVCQFTGTSAPGLLKERSKTQYLSQKKTDVLDPRCLSPLDRARSNRRAAKSKTTIRPQQPQEIVKDGIKFPGIINTPHAVAQVLNQQPGRLKAKDVRDTMLSQKDNNKPSSRQMKEALFEQTVRKNVYEERQNQLRWQVKLGDNQLDQSNRVKILEERDNAWNYYMFTRREDPIPENEYERLKTCVKFRRTMRRNDQLAYKEATFDPYNNDMWAVRHVALEKFVQAARKVIIRNRGEVKLKSLRKVVIDWSKKKYTMEHLTHDQQDKIDEDEEKEDIPVQYDISSNRIKQVTFPTFIPPDGKDDMAPDAVGVVPFMPTDVIVKKKVPFFNLKVAQCYQLNGYKPHDIHASSSGFIPSKLVRPLRSGAQEEIINLPVPDQVHHTEIEERDTTVGESTTSLSPPQALFDPVEYPPLHIFNPAPGLQVFHAPAPYSETSSDFHLCPLPRYICKDVMKSPHTSTQRKYLDREDIIRGTMSWKKFPSQGLTSLSNTPTLTGVWIPRWDDSFGRDILPHDVPPLLDSLPTDDNEHIAAEEENVENTESRLGDVNLTPEMVAALFPPLDDTTSSHEDMKITSEMFPVGNKMPSTNIPVGPTGPVPREKRELELEYYITKKYNRLGSKIQAKINNMNVMLTDPNLVLK